jgi:hypothetical protein
MVEATVAQNVGGRRLSEAYIIHGELLDGVGSVVTVCRHVQRRRRVETFAVHNSEATTVAQIVGGRTLSEAHVIHGGLLDSVGSGVTVCRPLQR